MAVCLTVSESKKGFTRKAPRSIGTVPCLRMNGGMELLVQLCRGSHSLLSL